MGLNSYIGRKTKNTVNGLNNKTYNLKKSLSNKSDEEVGKKALIWTAAAVGVATVAKKGVGLVKEFYKGVKEGMEQAREEIKARKQKPEEVLNVNADEDKDKVEEADFTEVK